MTKLSPKALRFIDAAVAESKDARVKAAWNGFDRDPAKELRIFPTTSGSCAPSKTI